MGPPYQPISLLSEELTKHKSFLYSFVEVESKIHVFFVVKATALSQLWLLVNRAFNSYMLSSPFLGKCKNKNEYWLALARPRPPFLQLQFNSCQNSVVITCTRLFREKQLQSVTSTLSNFGHQRPNSKIKGCT